MLLEKYVNEQKSFGQISRELGCSKNTVSYTIKKQNIPVRKIENMPSNNVSYGYQYVDDQLIPNLSERNVIKLMQNYRAMGLSYQQIADSLNTQGIPTRHRNTKGWAANTVYRILKRYEKENNC